MAVNAASRATMSAAGLTFARAFVSAEPYEVLLPGADQGEVEYELTRTTWLRRGVHPGEPDQVNVADVEPGTV